MSSRPVPAVTAPTIRWTDVRTTRRAVLALTVGLILGASVTAAASSGHHVGPIPGDQTVISGAVIRFLPENDGHPSFHANAAHVAAGVKSVRVDPSTGWVEVTQDMTNAPRNPVVTAQCQADEHLGGRLGVICGATGGTDRTRYPLYSTKHGRTLDLRKKADRDFIAGSTSNLWVQWTHAPGLWDR